MWRAQVEGTVQDKADPNYMVKLNTRTKNRGTVASLLSGLTFSLVVNGTLDAFLVKLTP